MTNTSDVQIESVTPQLRTTDLVASIDFYVNKLGFVLEFQYQDFYAGVRAGNTSVHLKLVDTPDPSIAFVDAEEHLHLYLGTSDVDAMAVRLEQNGIHLVRDVHDTDWGTRECVIKDNAGHTLHLSQRVP